MPKSITIRNVPDETRDELASRAARSGRSLQEYLRRELIELADREDKEALLARIQERKERSASHVSTEFIIEAIRDGRR